MRIIATIFFAFFGFISVSVLCSCSGDTRTTPMGYEFKVVKNGEGKQVEPGEVIILDMSIVDQNDSAWYDNRKSDYPEMIRIADPSKMDTERGISELFRMVKKGDSIEFPMRAKDVFLFMWKMDTPPEVDPNSFFTYRIKCREVFSEADAKKFAQERDSLHNEKEKIRIAAEEEEMKRYQAELEAYKKEQVGKDTVIIDNFLKNKNVKAKTLPSGIRYVVKAGGQGPTASKGDLVTMKYAGQLLDGKEFDAGEYAFRVGEGDVIEGWDLIASIMKKGTALTVFVPSSLSYGRGGRGPKIGPDAILVFEMELLSINQ